MTRYRDAAYQAPKTQDAQVKALQEMGYTLYWRNVPGYQLSVSKGAERHEFSEATSAQTVRAAYEGLLEIHGHSMRDQAAGE